jgi:hypothetical protein
MLADCQATQRSRLPDHGRGGLFHFECAYRDRQTAFRAFQSRLLNRPDSLTQSSAVARSTKICASKRALADDSMELALGPPHPKPVRPPPPEPSTGLRQGVRRLLVTSYPLAGSLAETYLHARGIAVTPDLRALRFHPRCFYRTTDPATGADRYPAPRSLIDARRSS